MCWRYSNADMKIDMVKELTDWWRRYTGELQVNSVKGTPATVCTLTGTPHPEKAEYDLVR